MECIKSVEFGFGEPNHYEIEKGIATMTYYSTGESFEIKINVQTQTFTVNEELHDIYSTGYFTATPVEKKLYKRYDLQDESDFEIQTLEGMKKWLSNWWEDHPDEEMDDDEHEELIKGILASDEIELEDRLGGIDYSYNEIDENGEEIVPVNSHIKTVLPWGYSVESEKINDEDVKITLVSSDDMPEEIIISTVANWTDIHKSYVDSQMKRMQMFRRIYEVKNQDEDEPIDYAYDQERFDRGY